LIRDDMGQVVLIPVDLELQGDTAMIYRDGSRLIIEPIPAEAAKPLDIVAIDAAAMSEEHHAIFEAARPTTAEISADRWKDDPTS